MSNLVWVISANEYPNIPPKEQQTIIAWLEQKHLPFEQVAVMGWDEPGQQICVKVFKLNEEGKRYMDPITNLVAADLLIFEGNPPFINLFKKYGKLETDVAGANGSSSS